MNAINTIKVYFVLLLIGIIIACILLYIIKKVIAEISENIKLETQQLNALMTAEEKNRIETQEIKKALSNKTKI